MTAETSGGCFEGLLMLCNMGRGLSWQGVTHRIVPFSWIMRARVTYQEAGRGQRIVAANTITSTVEGRKPLKDVKTGRTPIQLQCSNAAAKVLALRLKDQRCQAVIPAKDRPWPRNG